MIMNSTSLNYAVTSRHHDFIKQAIPNCYSNASAARIKQLQGRASAAPEWLRQASASEHKKAQAAIKASWASQNKVDKMLSQAQDLYAFAEPLLKQFLKQRYAIDINVKETFLRLYSSTGAIVAASKVRTVSLLDAALHNFNSAETFLPESDFITRPNASGHFEVTALRKKISVQQFTALCRELDIGAQYTRHLEQFLRPADAMVKAVVQQQLIQSQKDAFNTAAQLAMMKKDISLDAYSVVLGMLNDRKDLRLDGRPVRFHHLTVMDTQLSGIVLIAGELDNASRQGRVIAYVPHDPEHPLKEYPSGKAFAEELTRQLRPSLASADAVSSGKISYQQFFSRFVAHQHRGAFFARLNNNLVETTWHPTVYGVDQPNWREGDAARPHLHLGSLAFEDDIQHRYRGDLWGYLYEQQLNKVFNDAKEMAVSTADADRVARWAWIDNMEQILGDILNVALLVVTPFVPFLGELMIAYTLYQMVSEVVEGIVDLAEGQYVEGAEYLLDFTESLIQLGAFGAGMTLGKLAWSQLSPFVEGTTRVTLADGSQRLWNPDLAPYTQNALHLPADAAVDEHGLHLHQGKRLLRTDPHTFELEKDPAGQHQVKHPSRADAYRPKVHSNQAGAFVIEGEQPETWDSDTLMKRLAAPMDSLTDVFADIRQVSRTDLNAIRQMYVGRERALPLLDDTVTRFLIDRELQTFIDQLGNPQPAHYAKADLLLQIRLLVDNGLWPSDIPIQLVGSNGQVLWQSGTGTAPPVRLSQGVRHANVVETLLTHLSSTQLKTLMKNELGAPVADLQTNAAVLRKELLRLAQTKRGELFEARYRQLDRVTDADVQTVQAQVPGLPSPVARELLAIASPEERQEISRNRLPTRLKALAEHAREQVRLSRTYEGLYLQAGENADTDKLILHSAAQLKGWPTELRIEVREYALTGRVQDRVGPPSATLARTIVAREDGRFEPFDDQGNRLHVGTDLYSAILHALGAERLKPLGLSTADGEQLQRAIRAHTLPSYRLARVLSDYPIPRPTAFDPSVMRLRGGAPTGDSEVADLLNISEQYIDLVQPAFQPDTPQAQQYDYLRGLKLMHDDLYADECFDWIWQGFFDANTAQDHAAHQSVVKSIEALPDLKQLMTEAQFTELKSRLFTDNGLMPLTDAERDLASMARNLEQTGLTEQYQALKRAQQDNQLPDIGPLDDLYRYLPPYESVPAEPVTVSAETMAHLKMAQRAVTRAKELIPLSGNQVASIWEKGSSVMQTLKALREIDPLTGEAKADLTLAQAARKAVEIKGGNCSENSKVTFALLAAEERPVDIHIVAAKKFDHQFVLIGNDLSKPETLVVADSWPEIPTAHLASESVFEYHPEPIETLAAGGPVARFGFIKQQPAGPASLPPRESDDTILRLMWLNKSHYQEWTSTTALGRFYAQEGAVPISFQRVPTSLIESRITAANAAEDALQPLRDKHAASEASTTD